jgi:L-fuconolactonase
MNDFAIIDAHVHLWDPKRFIYPWLQGLPALNRPFDVAEFREATARANVAKLVFIECGCFARQSLAEVDWISEAAQREPRIAGIVAHAALEKGTGARRELGQLTRRPMVKGIRRSLQEAEHVDEFLNKDFVTGVQLLKEFGLTFDVCVRHEQLAAATELARRAPRVTFVLDHLGKPPIRAKASEPWRADLKAFASLPNTVAKISGLTTEADWKSWGVTDVRPYIDWALDCFGFDRVMFGGDWPVTTLASTYQRSLETVLECCAGATEIERRRFFQTNAARVYGI